jgi:hypothetical protein
MFLGQCCILQRNGPTLWWSRNCFYRFASWYVVLVYRSEPTSA